MTVLLLPPKESCKSLVKEESLYGTYVAFGSVNAAMTWHKVVRDKLILIASSNQTPEASVFDYLSDPARSTRFNFADQIWSFPSGPFSEISRLMVNTEWDQDDHAFMAVSPIDLFFLPVS